jgi:hypothetical protein
MLTPELDTHPKIKLNPIVEVLTVNVLKSYGVFT